MLEETWRKVEKLAELRIESVRLLVLRFGNLLGVTFSLELLGCDSLPTIAY